MTAYWTYCRNDSRMNTCRKNTVPKQRMTSRSTELWQQYPYRAMRNRPSRNTKVRQSAMVVALTPSAGETCSQLKKTDHRLENNLKRKGTVSGNQTPPPLRNNCVGACIIPIATITATVGLEKRDDTKTRRPCPGKKFGQHNNDRSAHANTPTTPTSTMQMEDCVPETHAPSFTVRATTAATITSFATPPCPSSPPVGIYYSFYHRTSDQHCRGARRIVHGCGCGASSHFIDNQFLSGIELKMNHYVKLGPPVTINVRETIAFMVLVKGFGRSSVGPYRLLALPVTIV